MKLGGFGQAFTICIEEALLSGTARESRGSRETPRNETPQKTFLRYDFLLFGP
jgi:hypothetical protein